MSGLGEFQGPRKMEHVTKREARQAGHSVCEAVTSLPYTARKPADQPKCDGSKSTINPTNTPARVLEPWNPGEVKVVSYPRTYGLDENGNPRTFDVQSHCRHCPVKGLYQPTKAAPRPAPQRPTARAWAAAGKPKVTLKLNQQPTGNGGGGGTAVPIPRGKRPAPAADDRPAGGTRSKKPRGS